jgi:NADH-quinone oxidoreductase subunit L
MLIPLMLLAVGACFAGYIGYEHFVGHNASDFWQSAIYIAPNHTALADAHHVPLWVKLSPLAVGAGGIALATVLYVMAPDWPARIAARFQGLYQFLLNKWYFDELYDALFVRPAFRLGQGLWKTGDGTVIDGIGPDGIATTMRNIARRAGALQSGYLYHYAFAMLIGVVVLITFYLFTLMG